MKNAFIGTEPDILSQGRYTVPQAVIKQTLFGRIPDKFPVLVSTQPVPRRNPQDPGHVLIDGVDIIAGETLCGRDVGKFTITITAHAAAASSDPDIACGIFEYGPDKVVGQ